MVETQAAAGKIRLALPISGANFAIERGHRQLRSIACSSLRHMLLQTD